MCRKPYQGYGTTRFQQTQSLSCRLTTDDDDDDDDDEGFKKKKKMKMESCWLMSYGFFLIYTSGFIEQRRNFMMREGFFFFLFCFGGFFGFGFVFG